MVNTRPSDLAFLRQRVHSFWLHLNQQSRKVVSFLEYKMLDLAQKWLLLKYNAYMMQQRRPPTILRKRLQLSMLKFYKEVCLLLEFVSVNQQASSRLLNKLDLYNQNVAYSQLPPLDLDA